MTRWRVQEEKKGEPARCPTCPKRPQLVPMRFVAVCGNGHLEDVNWPRWAHSAGKGNPEQRNCGKPSLKFDHLTGVGGGLDSLVVRCVTCKASRDLRDLPVPGALKHIGLTCRGLQPWQLPSEKTECEEDLIVLQRGASSVRYPQIASAIDIPPDSNWMSWGGQTEQILANSYVQLLLQQPNSPIADGLVDTAAHELGCTATEIRNAVSAQLGKPLTTQETGYENDMVLREWEALVTPAESYDPRDNFISRRVPVISSSGHRVLQSFAECANERLTDIVVVDRLREIRVLKGFGRHTMRRTVKPSLDKHVNFLPAIEVFGEGVFIRIDEQAIRNWESEQPVMTRTLPLNTRLPRSFLSASIGEVTSARFVMLHTLAHMLMRQMSFDAGYAASSIRERIYSTSTPESPLAGVLIYTAAGDSEGSLGGLARMGEPGRLIPVLARALGTAQWCSLDPVCGESTGQGTDSLSLAACHACALAAETSCTHSNVLLDRNLLVDPKIGFFRREVERLIEIQSEALT